MSQLPTPQQTSPLKVLTIVGARPQSIKAAMVSKAIAKHNAESPNSQIIEEIIHTGQHYDENMSDVFFREMMIPEPTVRLNCGGKSHGAMTGQMHEVYDSGTSFQRYVTLPRVQSADLPEKCGLL
jgi:UDP-N-acetylglucosamine 2-epimerase